jgi:SPP1 gp7 family putative phage head morphogenesis protein
MPETSAPTVNPLAKEVAQLTQQRDAATARANAAEYRIGRRRPERTAEKPRRLLDVIDELTPSKARQRKAMREQGRPKTKRIEADYSRALREIGRHCGVIIRAYPPGDDSILSSLMGLLRAYSDALGPWATATSKRMIGEADLADQKNWKALSRAMGRSLHTEITRTDVGTTFQQLLRDSIGYIKSIPLDAAERVQKLTIEGLENSSRGAEIREEILRSGEVSTSHAVMLGRTLTATASGALMQARAEGIGSEGYVWQTSRDSDVRESHRKMQGKFVRWDSPPTLDGWTAHAGINIANCRCYCAPVIPD